MNQALALLVTLLFEAPIAAALSSRDDDGTKRWRAWGLVACAASLLTHPFAWQASLRHFPTLAPEEKLALIELSVVAVETLVYVVTLRSNWRRALLVCALANAASFGVGVLWSLR